MPFWRLEDPEIKREPTSDGKDEVVTVTRGGMWDHQRRWWSARKFCKLLVGGFGSGKTISICKRAIASALENAPVAVAIVSPSFPMARKAVIPTLETCLNGKERLLQGAFRWDQNKGTHEYTLRYRMRQGKIFILSADDPNALKGSNLAAAYFDEPFIQEKKAFDMMLGRVRHPAARLREIGLGGTPENLNWGWQLATGDLKLEVDVVSASTMDNRALPDRYAKTLLETYDPKVADAYVHGKFVNMTKGLVYYGFDRFANVRRVEQIPDGATLLAGMDFNVNPMAFCVAWKLGNRMHVFREYELPNSDSEHAAHVLREDFPALRLVYPDPSGKNRSTKAPAGRSDFTALAKAGLTICSPQAQWPLRDSYNSVNRKLKSADLTIDPSCKKLVYYLECYSHELMQDDMSHLLDALRYPVTYLWPAGRPTAVVTMLQGA